MTSDEIANLDAVCSSDDFRPYKSNEADVAYSQIYWLREIALQLANLNELLAAAIADNTITADKKP